MLMWRKTDPRSYYMRTSRTRIVILIPESNSKGYEVITPYMGEVDTDHDYCVVTQYPRRTYVAEGELWPAHWSWIEFEPERGEVEKA